MNFGCTFRLNKFACFTLAFILFLIIYLRSDNPKAPPDKTDLVSIKSLLIAGIQAAERGGVQVTSVKDRNLNVKSKGETLEGVDDPVSDADFASHCAMFYSLKATFPKVTVISEEHVKEDSSCENQPLLSISNIPVEHKGIDNLYDEFVYSEDVTIWIDPLDATKEYTEKLYKYVTTMICVAINGNPIVGIIHYPFTQDTYWGWYTKKVSYNIADTPLKEENKEHPTVVVSRSHSGDAASFVHKAFGATANVETAAGAGYKVIGVMNGTYNMYLHTTAIKKWDLCAGNAILNTVNGKMTTLSGDPIDYSAKSDVKVTQGIIATRHNHAFYLSKLKNHLPS